ncbi:hypothetical protein K439DRAFT_1625966 [Ramaria rubella]|nr:hypothetical protein K439DRAFT_1625966 [Ramaria rubella]
MPFRHISSNLKQSLWLLAHGYTPEDTCKILGVSRSSVRRWVTTTKSTAMSCHHRIRIKAARACSMGRDFTHW